MNLVLLVLESFYACANTPSMETKLSVAGLVYFFDINKVYLPTYLFFLFLATISSFGPSLHFGHSKVTIMEFIQHICLVFWWDKYPWAPHQATIWYGELVHLLLEWFQLLLVDHWPAFFDVFHHTCQELISLGGLANHICTYRQHLYLWQLKNLHWVNCLLVVCFFQRVAS